MAWHEHVAFRVTSASCAWPEFEGARVPATRVAVIADPQITDFTSYPSFAPKGSWTLAAIERVSDAYQHRAFRLAVLPKRPEHVLFVGDLLDGGWNTFDEKTYEATARRFERVFRWPTRNEGGVRSSSPEKNHVESLHYFSVHGNHDVGYAAHAERFPYVYERHESRFGVSNYVVRMGGVDLVGVNAMALDGNPNAARTKETWSFVDSLEFENTKNEEEEKKQRRPRPRVLVTHLPLPKISYARGSCGGERFGPVIQPRFRSTPRLGAEYQDYLSVASARRLLETVRPTLTVSGHDHDRCAARHEIAPKPRDARTSADERGIVREPERSTERAVVTELTLGTFSWLMGNPKPSFTLLTVRGEDDAEEAAAAAAAAADDGRNERIMTKTRTCDLPNHLRGVWSYAFLGGLSFFLLLVWPSARVAAALMTSGDVHRFAKAVGVAFSPSDPKERDAPQKRKTPRLVWTRVVFTAMWEHCGPFFALLAVVTGGVASGTLWDISKP